MLKVWGRKTSINVQKVMWVVGELDLAHERIDVGGAFGGLDSPEFEALTPHGRIPVIQDGDTVVWESNAVVRYLAAQYDEDGLAPSGAGARAQADQWMDWHATTLYGDFISVFLGMVRTPPSQRNHGAIAQAAERTAEHYACLNAALAERPFIAGDRLTMGDIPVGATLYRYFTLDIQRPSLPNLEAYYERLQTRAAYRDHVMVSYEELRVTD